MNLDSLVDNLVQVNEIHDLKDYIGEYITRWVSYVLLGVIKAACTSKVYYCITGIRRIIRVD